jgi:multisubunit Na+/H+ antiporter MnhF subunit
MLVADGIGIVVGVILGKHIPERVIKWVSATVFIVFGLIGVYEALPSEIGVENTELVLALLAAISFMAAALLTRRSKSTNTNL